MWALDERRKLVRFDASASFLRDVEVIAMRVTRDRLVFALGQRGVAVVDTKSASSG